MDYIRFKYIYKKNLLGLFSYSLSTFSAHRLEAYPQKIDWFSQFDHQIVD